MPEELDGDIKKVHANYFLAQKDLTADELLDVLPIQFPMTHHFPGFPGIARYPVDAWEEAGAPMFTVKSWAKLAMKVATKGHDQPGRRLRAGQEAGGQARRP